MSVFEFSLIPIAIIIGFGITQLLSFWANLARNWRSVSRPELLISFTLWLLTVLLVHFAGLWEYREVRFGSLGAFLVVISPTLFFMLSISVMVPSSGELSGNLSDYYFERCRMALMFAAIASALSGVPDLLPGVISPPSPWLLMTYVVPLAALALTGNRTAHVVGHVVLWLVIMLAQIDF